MDNADSPRPPSSSAPSLSVVFSFRNEEENIPELLHRSRAVLSSEIEKGVIREYELIFVNDASTDKSLELLVKMNHGINDIKIINMSRNFGVYPCVFAGLEYSSGDLVVYMDADLQDPPEVIPAMLSAWASEEKVDVVHTIRENRLGESWFKLWITKLGYKLLKRISDIDLPVEAGDFKLLSRKATKHLIRLKEKIPYTRGLVCWIGFKQLSIKYQRQARFGGTTKFRTLGLGAIKNFSNSAFISFSSFPLQLSSVLGFLGCLLSVPIIAHVFYEKLSGRSVPGWTAIMTTILFIGSIQLLALGFMGLYIHSIFLEVKGRPNYIIDSVYGFNVPSNSSDEVAPLFEDPESVELTLKHGPKPTGPPDQKAGGFR